jgi:precorrin-6Y C5,15-methyltransferase (decarboxylating)
MSAHGRHGRAPCHGEAHAWPVVHIIGIGEEGPAGLGANERDLIARADLLCGGARHLAFFPEHPAERIVIRNNIAQLVEQLRAIPDRRRAVVLASGDPCFFGIGPLLARALGRERVQLHPHISAVALAFNRLALAWQEATVLSAHGRPLAGIVAPALAAARMAILTEPEPNTPAAVARALLDAGMEPDARAWVCERLGGPAERIIAACLDELPGRDFDPLNVLVIDRDSARVVVPRQEFGLPDEAYESLRGQITKSEVRAVTLARLEPWRATVAWDIGAGSGALALELAGLMPAGRVYAVERDAEQIAVLRRNLAAHPRPNLTLVPGAAPAALSGLPVPDAVFIGGTGGALAEVLTACYAALRPGGRLIANFAQLESLALWREFARARGLEGEIVQLAAARGVPMGAGTRLAPQNPVFITALTKAEAVS